MAGIVRKLNNREGSVLFTVLVIMTVAVLLGTAALVLSSAAYNQTQQEIRSQQAYYTASAALDGMVSYLSSADSDDALMQTIAALAPGSSISSAPGSITGIGEEETVEIAKLSDGSIKITASSLYAGKKRTISAFMAGETSLYFSSFFTATGGNSLINNLTSFIGEWNLTNSELRLQNSCVIDGTIRNTGSIVFTNNSPSATDGSRLISQTMIQLENNNNPNLQADLFAHDIKLINGTSHVYGDVYVTGTLNVGNVCTFHGNIYKGEGATIVNEGNIRFADAAHSVIDWVGAQATMENEFVYTSIEYPAWVAPDGLTPMNNPPVNLEIITSISFIPNQNDTYNLTVNTEPGGVAQDVYINVTGNNRFNTSNVTIRGNGRVFLFVSGEYFGGGVQGGNVDGRVYSEDTKPQLYIISTSGRDVNMRDKGCTVFNGYLYAPNSKFTFPGNRTINGSVITKYFDDINGLSANYIPPDDDIAVSIGGSTSGSSSTSWTVAGYSN